MVNDCFVLGDAVNGLPSPKRNGEIGCFVLEGAVNGVLRFKTL